MTQEMARLESSNLMSNVGENANEIPSGSDIRFMYQPFVPAYRRIKKSPLSFDAIFKQSAGCLLAEMYVGRPIMPGRTEVEQLHRIFKLCGSPSEDYWKKMKLPTSFRPLQHYKPGYQEAFRDFPDSSFGLLTKLLALYPSYRGTTASALQSFIHCSFCFSKLHYNLVIFFELLGRSALQLNISIWRMTLLLGPPGCGKSTLLLTLSGKLSHSLKVAGKITYNGYRLEEFFPQKTSAYISQYDLHTPEMTVMKILDFSARFQGIGSRAGNIS